MPYISYWRTKEILFSPQIFVYSKNSQVRQLFIIRDHNTLLTSKICGSYKAQMITTKPNSSSWTYTYELISIHDSEQEMLQVCPYKSLKPSLQDLYLTNKKEGQQQKQDNKIFLNRVLIRKNLYVESLQLPTKTEVCHLHQCLHVL